MKKIAIILFMIFRSANLHAQPEKMRVYKNDGTVLSYEIDSIAKITTSIGPLPQYYVMNIFSRSVIPRPVSFETQAINSIVFDRDTGNHDFLTIRYDSTGDGMSYRIDGPLGVDSITFSQYENDTNVMVLPNTYWDVALGGDSGYGYYNSAVWRGNQIYCSYPGRYYELDSNLNITYDTVFAHIGGPWNIGEWALALDNQGNRLLSVSSKFSLISIGWLLEDRLDSATYQVLDSTQQVSNAVYFPGTDNIIYYAYGSYSDTNLTPADAGYYLLDRASGTRTLLLHYISDLGPQDVINGFDISPDGKKLLFASTEMNRGPLAIEYDLSSHISDTLNIKFDSLGGWNLWVRYNHDGSKILYSNYPVYDGGYAGDSSEIGIIDRATLSKRVQRTSPNNELVYLTEFPEWSPDERHIVYGCAPILIEPPGEIGNFQLCILKTIH